MHPLPSPDRWKVIEPLIDAAIDLAPEARPDFIRDACGADAELAAELTRLLAEFDRRDTLLQLPAAERFLSLINEDSRIPEVLGGRYRIAREIGSGGMASVYLAHDLTHDRPVAVKVLHAELTAAVGAERFLAEIRVMAKLQHPHLMPLHDSGHANGILFYVMPYIHGESLRQRVQREGRLSLAEATRIACEVASALDAAHAQGVIHRDIKPENILFSADVALVADFGIALGENDRGARRTRPGMMVGTPQYMSPEQATGDAPIDRRTDVYALGTVMFEMLTGEPPFTGANASSVLAKRAAVAAPSVRVLRSTVPLEMERVVARALARDPLDRYDTAGEFANALRRSLVSSTEPSHVGRAMQPVPPSRSDWPLRRWMVAAGIVIATAIGMIAIVRQESAVASDAYSFMHLLQRVGLVPPPLDTLSYLVLSDRSVDAAPDVAEPLRNALRHWREVTVVEGENTGASPRTGTSTPSTALADQHAAMSLHAGRYIRLHARTSGDSLDVSADLHDTRSDARLGTARIRLGSDRAISERAMDSLSDALLFRDITPQVTRPEGTVRTASLGARAAFLRGQVALENGSFARADSEFSLASRLDPQYAQAIVWHANVRSWMGSRDRPWVQLIRQAEQAVAGRALAPTDSGFFAALRAMADERESGACTAWSRLTTLNRYDFAAWYGFANCQRHDAVVLRDPGKLSRWHFRSSYANAIRAYEQAFRLQPSLLHGFGGRSLGELQTLLYTRSSALRMGRALRPDTQTFYGIGTWAGDSLAFLPLTAAAAKLAPRPAAASIAVQREREALLEITRMWRSEFPDDADAAEAVAVALGMLGDRTAIDTLRLARRLATPGEDRIRIAFNEVFVRLKFSLPDDTAGLRAARALADSLLPADTVRDPTSARTLASIAALVGRADRAAALATIGGLDEPPPAIAATGPALVAHAALGGEPDSLASLEEQVESGIRSLPENERTAQRQRWVFRAAMLAFPEYRLRALGDPETSTVRDAAIAAAAAAGDSSRVHSRLAQIRDARRLMRQEDVTIDAAFPEAAAQSAIGDYKQAADWLDPVFGALRSASSQDLATVARTGSLVRAMVLRATLADRLGDVSTARRFAAAVVVLWSGADPFLRATVQNMAALAR